MTGVTPTRIIVEKTTRHLHHLGTEQKPKVSRKMRFTTFESPYASSNLQAATSHNGRGRLPQLNAAAKMLKTAK